MMPESTGISFTEETTRYLRSEKSCSMTEIANDLLTVAVAVAVGDTSASQDTKVQQT